MQAILFDHHGSPENLYLAKDHPMPEPATGEVRIRVRAVALNRVDNWVRKGFPGLNLSLPHIPGSDAAGDIDKVGDGVDGWNVGDRVVIDPGLSCGSCEFCRSGRENLCDHYRLIGLDRSGTCAEYIIVPARNLLKLPDPITYSTAAAVALVYLTAWHGLITRANLRAGESVLVIGASGGVNTACIDIARLVGAKIYVIGSSAAKLDVARTLGAEELIDRSAEAWATAVLSRTEGQGVDVVIDSVGGETLSSSVRVARKGGRILLVGTTSGAQTDADLTLLFNKEISLIGTHMAPHSDFVTVMRLIFDGKLHPVIGAIYPLEKSIDAYQALERGDVFGKIVIEIP